MAQIDVTDLMVDPDFVDTISIVSRVPTVDAYGQQTLADTTVVTVGSVQPADQRTVQKMPEAMRVENLSSFWVKGIITASSSGQYSSVLVFQGTRYQVKWVEGWSNFGAGYCEGVCVAEVPAP